MKRYYDSSTCFPLVPYEIDVAVSANSNVWLGIWSMKFLRIENQFLVYKLEIDNFVLDAILAESLN